MSTPTKGLRLAFIKGPLGLHFVADEKPYPENNGPEDMAYVNQLLEAAQTGELEQLRRIDKAARAHVESAASGYLYSRQWEDLLRALYDGRPREKP